MSLIRINKGTFVTDYLTINNLGNTTPMYTLSIDSNGNVVSGATVSNFTGGTVSGATNFTNGLTSTTISATTYYNLPTDITVTGGTYSNGTTTFTNNTGGTFSVSGYYTGGTVINNSNIVYVSKSGNDLTGSAGNIALAFLTLEAALSAATSGTTIYVFPGDYTATTTTTNGLAKSGIKWYFEAGATVTKASTGDIFNLSGLTGSFDVLGYGNFIKTTNAGYIHSAGAAYTWYVPFDFVFECNNITQSAGNTFSAALTDGVNSRIGTYKMNNVTVSSGNIFNLTRYGFLNISFNKMVTSAGYCLTMGDGSYFINMNGNYLQSTSTAAIANVYGSQMNLNIGYIAGVTFGIIDSSIASNTFNLNTSYVSNIYKASSGIFTLNGTCGYLQVSSGIFKGGICNIINCSGGHVETTKGDSYSVDTYTAGEHIITYTTQTYSPSANFNGGIITILGKFSSYYTYSELNIGGATVIWDGEYTYGGNDYVGTKTAIKLTSGKLFVNGGFKNSLTSQSLASCINYVGGTLIINGGTLITSNSDCPPIIASTTGATNIKIYSGGLNTNRTENGGTLAAKKQKTKLTVNSVGTTTIVLNDGTGGNETFTESNTGVYNTTALLAQRMVSLINASGTLDVTASQANPGTDAFFYLESDIAGTPFTQSGLVNLTSLGIRENSYAMVNTTGGMIIEDSDIE